MPAELTGRWRGGGAPAVTRTLVAQVMTTPVVTATEAMPFRDVVALLHARDIGAVPVVAPDGEVLGLVSRSCRGSVRPVRHAPCRSGLVADGMIGGLGSAELVVPAVPRRRDGKRHLGCHRRESACAWMAVGLVPGGVGGLADERICETAEFGEPGLRELRGGPCRVSAVIVLVSLLGVAGCRGSWSLAAGSSGSRWR